MKQKISRLTLQSLSNVLTSRSIVRVAIQFPGCANATLNRNTVPWWHKYFKERRVRIEDNLWSGHSSTVIDYTSIAVAAAVSNKDRHVTLRLAIHLSQNTRKWSQNAKNKKCIVGYFVSLLCILRPLPLSSLFTFCSILCQGRHSCDKSKDFVVYFFTALIKLEMKYEQC